jgi:hypothetical protein
MRFITAAKSPDVSHGRFMTRARSPDARNIRFITGSRLKMLLVGDS